MEMFGTAGRPAILVTWPLRLSRRSSDDSLALSSTGMRHLHLGAKVVLRLEQLRVTDLGLSDGRWAHQIAIPIGWTHKGA